MRQSIVCGEARVACPRSDAVRPAGDAASLEYAIRVLAAETRADDEEDDDYGDFEVREIELE
jgi:hypothetical protein